MSTAFPLGEIERIAYAVRCGARVASRIGDADWCELISVTFPNKFGEDKKTVHICAMPARVNEAGELVRLYLHFDNCLALASPIRRAIRVALEPFTVGTRQFAVHDTEEGFKFVCINDGEIDDVIHDVYANA